MARKSRAETEPTCICGNPDPFEACCGPLIYQQRRAATAEALMRSRYSAYVKGEVSYLLDSWHPDTRPERLTLDPEQRWLGLKILGCEQGGLNDDRGTVEFVARFKVAGRGHRLHEISRFARTSKGWHYLDGTLKTRQTPDADFHPTRKGET